VNIRTYEYRTQGSTHARAVDAHHWTRVQIQENKYCYTLESELISESSSFRLSKVGVAKSCR